MSLRSKPIASLRFALADIRETLAIWDRNPDANPAYVAKLLAEREAVSAEIARREKR
jgi:hypothetical protein